MTNNTPTPQDNHRRRDERRMFIFLVVFLFPILSVAIVSGYGFVVWMSHILTGPPGPAG